MAMLIGKFHRLIQSRLVWAAFLVVVVFAFVIWGMQVPRAARARSDQVAGYLHGKPVPWSEFQNAWQHEYVRLLLMLGRPPTVDAEVDRVLTDRAWRRLISLTEAERWGLQVADSELVEQIQGVPLFQEQGRFRLDRYQSFLRETLGSLGYPAAFFEEHVRQELVLQKLQDAIASLTLIGPDEIDRAVQRATDRYALEYLVIPREAGEKVAKPSEEDIRAFYERNRDRYRTPPRMVVETVLFPIAEYLDRVAPIPEARLEEYYQEHSSEFLVPVVRPESGGEGQLERVVAPFELVRADIEKKLRRQAALQMAFEDAHAFWKRISPLASNRPISFAIAAAELGRTIQRYGPFGITEPVAHFAAGSDFHRAAFDLEDTPQDRCSPPIETEDGYYVLCFVERIPSTFLPLEEILDRVTRDAREEMITAQLVQLAQAARSEAETGIPLAELAAKYGGTHGKTPAFTLREGFSELPELVELLKRARTAEPGEWLGPMESKPDRAVIARIAERQPAPPEEIPTIRPIVEDLLQRQHTQMLFEAWQRNLLSRADFRPVKQSPTPTGEDD